MYCYSCMETDQFVHAVAICRWCGGAMCPNHAREVRSAPQQTPLMVPTLPPRRELVCQCCWDERARAGAPPAQSSRRRRVRQTDGSLPNAIEAVQLAEAILRGEEREENSPFRQLRHHLQVVWVSLAGTLKLGRKFRLQLARSGQASKRPLRVDDHPQAR